VSDSFFQVIARYQPRDGQLETVLELLAELTTATRAEPGCVSFEYFRNVENPGEVVIVERFVDQAGFAAHRDTEHFTRIGVEQIVPLLEARSSTKAVATLV
jgi:quinol monooxygenase YgiN